MSKRVEAEKYCLDCKEETTHVLHYVDDLLKEGRCTKCGSVFHNKMKLLEVYGERLMDRVLSKPLRLAAEIKENPTETILGLPKRAVKKPFEEMFRIVDLLEEEESESEETSEEEQTGES